MKGRHQAQVATEAALSYHPESAPNSSAVLAVTVLAGIEDVLALIRTAALLGRDLKASTSVDVLGEGAIYLGPDHNGSQVSLDNVLGSIEEKLYLHGASQPPVFAVQANITAASFLTAGTITVLVRSFEPIPVRPTLAR